jgi:PA14 domain-containing protein/dolichyl-phosphate-mannose-protein mannosyltransferase
MGAILRTLTGLRPRTARSTATLTLFALTVLAIGVERGLRPTAGASGEYYAGIQRAGAVRVRALDPDITTLRLNRNWPWRGEPFSVRWSAWLLVPATDRYRFVTRSDDGSALYVDGALVVDNGGTHEGRGAFGDVDLSGGFHALTIDYFEAGGGREIEALWSRSGAPLARLTAPELVAAEPAPLTRRWWPAAIRARDVLVLASTLVWFGWTAVAPLIAGLRAIGRRELQAAWPRSVLAVAIVSGLLAVVGIWWGLPGNGWAADELSPDELATAVDMRLSHGWISKYPPVHYMATIAVTLPIWVARDIDPSLLHTGAGEFVIGVLSRFFSLALACGTLLLVYCCGRRISQHTGALFAAAAIGLSPMWAYYAKVANLDVPYLFWFSLALLAYLRLADEARAGDLRLYAVAATLSVCTKDQAYGLFVLPTLAILWRLARTGRETRGRPDALGIAPFVGAAALALLVFAVAHNVIWNWTGFLGHIRAITGSESAPFRMFPRTAAGQLEMAVSTIRLVTVAMSLPGLVLAIAGLAGAAWTRDRAGARLGWLAWPAISYYITFMAVVGYTYDRFLLPILIVLALVAGYFTDRAAGLRPWLKSTVAAVAALALAINLGRTALVDLAMVGDSRYSVEQWMEAHVAPETNVGVVGLAEYLPRLGAFRLEDLSQLSRGDLMTTNVRYLVVNGEFVRRFDEGTEPAAAMASLFRGQAGYRLALDHRTPIPLEDVSYPRAVGSVWLSNLTKINPRLLVFERTTR